MGPASGKPENVQAPAIGAVLAGGAGRRLGGQKATVDLDGRPLIAYALEAVERAGLDPVVVAKPSSALPALSCRVLREPEEPQHPLAGIVAALADAGKRPVVALACDMPLVSPALLASLASAEEAVVVPALNGQLQPLPGRYSPEALPALREALAQLQPLRKAVELLVPRTIDEDELGRYGDPGSLCFNVNTPADLKHARRMLASPAR
jgi:molybdopterin-guanine dinucleotide biosynthesis protein A